MNSLFGFVLASRLSPIHGPRRWPARAAGPPRIALVALGVALATAGLLKAAEAPVAVSPGSSKGARIGTACPTFSWGANPGARSYELVVYRLGEEVEDATPALSQSVVGSALSWTPSLDRCLKRGRQYAWSVRAVGAEEVSEWSSPSLFQIAAGPSAAELEAALRVVRSHLESTASAASENGRSGGARAGSERAAAPSADGHGHRMAASPGATRPGQEGSGEAIPSSRSGVPPPMLNLEGSGLRVGAGEEFEISIQADSALQRSLITSTAPTSTGLGETEMRMDGLAIGKNAGSPGEYMLKVVHGSFGVDFARANTSNHWEFLTGFHEEGDLLLYANGDFRGSFSGIDGTWNPASDRRVKQRIQPMERVLPRVLQLQPARYQYTGNDPHGRESLGFIAQEVKELFPELVSVVEDERSRGMHVLNYCGFGSLAIKAIQEQQQTIDALSRRVESLLGEQGEP